MTHPHTHSLTHTLSLSLSLSQRIFQMWCGTVGSFLAHYCHLRTGYPTALTRAYTTMGMGGHRQGLTLCPVQATS